MNFEKDTDAAAIVLKSGIPLVLAPFEVSSQLQLRLEDLNQLTAHSSNTAQFVSRHAQPWLGFWRETWRVPFFHPFDCLAVLYLTSPKLLTCTTSAAKITAAPSDHVIMGIANRAEGDVSVHGYGAASKLYLHVDSSTTETKLKYCHHIMDTTKARQMVIARLIGKHEQDL